MGNGLADLYGELCLEAAGQRGVVGVPWARLSRLSGGLLPGHVALLAGSPGVGKSFLLLEALVYFQLQGIKAKLLPLEDSASTWARRALALLAGDYGILDRDQNGGERRLNALERHRVRLSAITGMIHENPRHPEKIQDGQSIVPDFGPRELLAWIEENAKNNRVLVIDPVTAIDLHSSDRDGLRLESDLCRRVCALAAASECTVVLSFHLKNRAGAAARGPASLDDLAGASTWQRLAQLALVIEAHDTRESEVFRRQQMSGEYGREIVTHNRTVLIAKAREGSGGRSRLAFLQRADRPGFDELGVIVPGGGRK